MIEKSEVTKTEICTKYFCDICKKNYSWAYTARTCSVCGRDVCSDCSILTDDMITEYVLSDYPDRICNICWDLREFRKALNDLVDHFESDKSEICAKWKAESLRSGV